MNNFLEIMDKINTISFIIAVVLSVLVLVFLFINMKKDNKKKSILINKNRVNRK